MTRLVLPILLLLVFSAEAHAFLIPTRTYEGRTFPTAREDVEIGTLRVYLERAERTSGPVFLVDAELALRSPNLDPERLTLMLADEPAYRMHTRVWVDGVPGAGRDARLGYEPTLPDVSADAGTFFEAEVRAGHTTIVRATWLVDARSEPMGRAGVKLPTQWLSLWGRNIPSAHIELALNARPLALETTLSGMTRYDEPENRVTWFLREWRPRIPFETWWITPWSALLLVANVEQCPEPMHVVQLLTQGWLDRLRNHNAAFDEATLQFCASLPMVLHGHPFPSAEVRAELQQVPWTRYLPTAAEALRVYDLNPDFSEAMLLEVEAMYRNALRMPLTIPVENLPDDSDPDLRLIP